ncbi:MAG TPA: glycerophosphodiester phosphodiesterase [Solirubrobacterales bacterium]|nr:glycerophosphodiester phosphodiesterase [Solirubrobacterales bacterium]
MTGGNLQQLRRVGHKGADAIRRGNTLESFEAAVAAGVDMIELDVLWTREGHPRLPPQARTPLVIAHDWEDAAGRDPLTLAQALDAFTRPPLDRIEFDLDLKLAGREDEVVEMLHERDLLPRAMTSGMEVSSIHRLRRLEPALRRGWTFPKITRDWRKKRWARPLVAGGLVTLRRRAPAIARRGIERLEPAAMWVFHPVITRRLVATTRSAGVELIAWTVDDLPTMRRLVDLGVDGICTNDPRLFAQL